MNPSVEKTIQNMKSRGFAVTYFETAAEAADYLDHAIDGQTVGFGGSVTLTRYLRVAAEPPQHRILAVVQRRLRAPGGTLCQGRRGRRIPFLRQRHRRDRRAPQYRRHRQPRGLHALRPQKALPRLRRQQDRAGLRRSPVARPQHRPAPKTPSACTKTPPAPPAATNATTAAVPSASAGASWCSGSR